MADRLDYYFRQRVTEAELDLGFALLEKADRNLAADIGLYGIIDGIEPSPHLPVPDLSIDLTSPGRAYDNLGQRIFFGTGQVVDCSVDHTGVPTDVPVPGQERWLGVFVRFDRLLSDPRTDGNSQDVYFRRDESFRFLVRQGPTAPAGSASKVPLEADELLICDVRRSYGQLQIMSPDIDVSRRQAFIFARGDSVEIESGLWNILGPAVDTVQSTFDEVDAELNAHFGGTARRHAASAIDYAPHGFVASTQLQAAVNELIDDLGSATAGSSGALRIGADAVVGTPHALAAGNVDGQLSQLLDWLNAHESAAAGAHNASAIAAAAHAYITGTSVQAQLQEIVGDLQSQSAGLGAAQIGDAALSGSPNALAAGTVREQLSSLLGDINDHINDASGAHAASAVSYDGATGSASNSAPTYAAPANPVDDALDFLLAEVNKRIAKAGDSMAGGLSIASGLDVGFAGTPLSDRIRLGDADFRLDFSGTDPRLYFHANDFLQYVRSANRWEWLIANTVEMQLDANGLTVANDVVAGGSLAANNGLIYAGGSGLDYIFFGSGAWDFYVADNNEMRLTGSGLAIQNGLFVGNYAGTPSDDCAWVGDANFGLDFPNKRLRLDANDYIEYDRAANELKIHPGNTHSASVKNNGVHALTYQFLNTITVRAQFPAASGHQGGALWDVTNGMWCDEQGYADYESPREWVMPIPALPGWVINKIGFMQDILGSGSGSNIFKLQAIHHSRPNPFVPNNTSDNSPRARGTISRDLVMYEIYNGTADGWFIFDSSAASGLPYTVPADSHVLVGADTLRSDTNENRLWWIVVEYIIHKPWGGDSGEGFSY